MNAHRLRHLFSRALRASLATPLVLAGCGGEGADLKGYAPVACDNGQLAVTGLSITPAPDYLQLRYVDDIDLDDASSPYSAGASQGQSCETATHVSDCQTALKDATVDAGFHQLCIDFCSSAFLVTTRGDDVTTYATVDTLRSLLGPIDTAQEAALLAYADGYSLSCSVLKQGAVKANADGSFNVVGTKGYAGGPNTQLTQHVVQVSASGEVRELEEHVLEKGSPNCSIGRRPVGLQDVDACEDPDALGRFFADAAHLEAASVHAFLRLRDELALHGAHAGLQDAARRSAMDEVLHTQVTGRLARRFGAAPRVPTVASLPLRPLVDVALDNAVEGCVRETYGALVAHHQALHARDTGVREAMVRIAEDETRHAGLSWDIHQWAGARLSSGEREALKQAQRRAVALLREEVARPLDTTLVTEAGLPTPPVALALLDTLEQELWS